VEVLVGIAALLLIIFLKVQQNNSNSNSNNPRWMLGWIPWCQDNKQNEKDNSTEGAAENNAEETKALVASVNTNNSDNSDSTRCTTSSNSKLLYYCWDHLYWKRPIAVIEDILTTMGACLSRGGGALLIENIDGDEQDFHNRFIEDRVLGEGEFGVVTLVHDMKANDQNQNTMACKTLRKGVVFIDNTLFAPVKSEILQCEVNILRTLAGEHYCMKLMGVWETARVIYVVTEYCAGGEMMEYVSKQEEDLRTDDVSRVAFQMLDAVNHCASHHIIHRDIKPENVMFKDPTPGSDLRLIDTGSGTDKVVEGNHTTFAGSAFYISPEMFQRTYTQKTDVWSVGVTLYVLVAGYPADKLQRAFNLMQSSATRNLRDLPNFPENMPDSFYDMLEGALVYRHKKRKTAAELLTHEFVQFHKTVFTVEQIVLEAQQEANDEAMNDGRKSQRKTQSVSLRGSVGRHSMFLDYQKYERSLTTLLATLLDKKELVQLMTTLNEKLSVKKEKAEDTVGEQPLLAPMEKRLDVIPINELKKILEEQKQEQV
jgi:serine/threonine protein kinase